MSDKKPHTQPKSDEKETDVAALSAGVIAVAVTTMIEPGPYNIIGTILAITLLILIVAYSWEKWRELRHSIAFAAVIGLVGMQIVGFGLELRASPKPMGLIEGSNYGEVKDIGIQKAKLEACSDGGYVAEDPTYKCPKTAFEKALRMQQIDLQLKSRVNSIYLLLAWCLISAFTLALDRGRLPYSDWWPNSKAARSARPKPRSHHRTSSSHTIR